MLASVLPMSSPWTDASSLLSTQRCSQSGHGCAPPAFPCACPIHSHACTHAPLVRPRSPTTCLGKHDCMHGGKQGGVGCAQGARQPYLILVVPCRDARGAHGGHRPRHEGVGAEVMRVLEGLFTVEYLRRPRRLRARAEGHAGRQNDAEETGGETRSGAHAVAVTRRNAARSGGCSLHITALSRGTAQAGANGGRPLLHWRLHRDD